MTVQSFSRRGAWLKLILKSGESGRLGVQTLRNQVITKKDDEAFAHEYYDIALFREGREVPYAVEACASHVHISFDGGEAQVVFADEQTLVIYGTGCDIHWIPKQPLFWGYSPREDEFLAIAKRARTHHHFRTEHGQLEIVNPGPDGGIFGAAGRKFDTLIARAGRGGTVAVAFRESVLLDVIPPSLPSPESALEEARSEVCDWQAKCPSVPSELEESVRLAWQLMGSFQVAPAGAMTRQALLCSKNSWLNKIWSWDNCFHSIGLAHGSLELAFDQLLLFFENQFENGALPEPLSDLQGEFGFTKPPVYGWTLRELIHYFGVDACRPYFTRLLPGLERLTRYWLACHRHPDDPSGLCFYRHGNDSGWDNGTVFDGLSLVRSPDLDSFLIVQMEVCALLACEAGNLTSSREWERMAEQHLHAFLQNMVVGNRFVSRLVPGDAISQHSQTCALRFIPIILGKRLPQPVVSMLLADLFSTGDFFTESGIASEAVTSDLYLKDGYWRGPVWAPVQVLVQSGLRDLGELELERELIRRCTQNWNQYPTFSEHHAAVTGEPLKAPGVMWTAAAHVHFAHLLSRSAGSPSFAPL